MSEDGMKCILSEKIHCLNEKVRLIELKVEGIAVVRESTGNSSTSHLYESLGSDVPMFWPPEENSATSHSVRSFSGDELWLEAHNERSAYNLRTRFFPGEAVSESPWIMLLELFAARLEGRSMQVSSVAACAPCAPTTGLRYAMVLVDLGLVNREQDMADARRKWLSLSEKGAKAMEQYIARKAILKRTSRPDRTRQR